MVVMLGVGFVPPPVQGVGNVVPGRADEARPGSPAPSIATIPWTPPWHPKPTHDPLAPVVVEYISPSACETIELCPRKWAFPKLDRVEKESTDAADLGHATHAQHDRYFKYGTPYDLTTRAGELALATSGMLPDRETFGLRVEQELRFRHPSVLGVWFGGKIDLNWAEQTSDFSGGEWRLRRIVLDHKTTGQRRYMKLTRSELLGHPQAPVYGMMFFIGEGQERLQPAPGEQGRGTWRDWAIDAATDPLELRWNYVLTSSKAASIPTEKSWHEVTKFEIDEAFEKHVVPHARKLLQIVDQANAVRSTGHTFGAADVEAKPGDACFAFGGCPFRSRCNIAPIEGVRAMTAGASDFLTRVGVTAPGQAPGQPWSPPGQAQPGPPQGAPPPQGAWVPPGQAPQGAPPGAQYGAPQGAPPQAWQNPQPGSALAQAQAGYPPNGAAAPGTVGYGTQINPPEQGQQMQPPPPDAAAQEKARIKAEKAEAKRLAAEAAATAAQHSTNNMHVQSGAGLSFEAFAMAQVMASLAPSLAPQILAGQQQPGIVAELSAAMVARATQLGVR